MEGLAGTCTQSVTCCFARISVAAGDQHLGLLPGATSGRPLARRAGLQRCDQPWPQFVQSCRPLTKLCHLHATQESRTALAGLQNSSSGYEGRRWFHRQTACRRLTSSHGTLKARGYLPVLRTLLCRMQNSHMQGKFCAQINTHPVSINQSSQPCSHLKKASPVSIT